MARLTGALDVHFGGPGRAPGALRDLLARRLAALPGGGRVDWVSYYFRDRRLAHELARARRRGVDVRVTLEGFPRTARANRAVIALLDDALGDGLRVVRSRADRWPRGKFWRARLHEKLYCFSHPTPVAFIGSFNPSGDDPEEAPDVVREIGDQDRGYNDLVEIRDAAVASALALHTRRLHAGHHGVLARLSPASNRVLRGAGLEIHFTPRLRPAAVLRLARGLARGSRLRIAASHLSGRAATGCLTGVARRGGRVEIVAEATPRRVPPQVEARLAAEGIAIRRLAHPQGVPMHDKFALVEDPVGGPRIVFGSFNWTQPSLRHNREVCAISRDAGLFAAFEARWRELSAQTA